MRLAVFSDMHAAADAFAAALTDARTEGFDRLVLLGDLLTYGPFPQRTMELAYEATTRHESIVIEGNHDRIYRDRRGQAAYLPATSWIRESIEWTSERIEDDAFDALAWQPEYRLDDTLFAHANPYAFGDWAYLRSDDDFRTAIGAISARGLKHGIFGHSHRFRQFDESGGTALTVGSVGQPRSTTGKHPEWTLVTLSGGQLTAECRAVQFDWRSHCEAIQSTNLSETTKNRLCEFFQ